MFGKVMSNITVVGTRASESYKPEFKFLFHSITLANVYLSLSCSFIHFKINKSNDCIELKELMQAFKEMYVINLAQVCQMASPQ